jgi:putative ABC transport system permease protein
MGSELAQGRFLLSADTVNNSPVVVLSFEAADDIFGRSDVVGLYLKLDGIRYLIVGVLAEDESMTSALAQTDAVYVPYSVVQRMAASSGGAGAGGGSLGITSFYAVAATSDSITAAEVELTGALLTRFENDSDAFSVRNQNTLAETMSEVTSTFALLLGGIAAISLIVGGIGIMNIMLVSMTERTREIGIRKAVGASRPSITLQFLIEALVICLIGCAIGIAVSGLVLLIVNLAANTSIYTFSGEVILIAVLFSTVIGVVFGLYPANKAAGMSTIAALRYE